jgi:hypothetical protein
MLSLWFNCTSITLLHSGQIIGLPFAFHLGKHASRTASQTMCELYNCKPQPAGAERGRMEYAKLDYLPRRTMSRPALAPLAKGENGHASGT